jgi:antigen flippase
LTSLQTVVAAVAIILIDLLGRAGLDKMLAVSGGPTNVGLWAQLQSIVELVGAVTSAGVLQGLTVLITQARREADEHGLLRDALKLGLATSVTVGAIVAVASPKFAGALSQNRIPAHLFWLAAFAGCISVLPSSLNAYWLGKHQQHRMLWLSVLNLLVLTLVAVSAWRGLSLEGLIWTQSALLLVAGSIIWLYLKNLLEDGGSRHRQAEHFRKLARFVPVGLAIGIMSPASMLMARSLLSSQLSWSGVGFLQALWRSTEWVTATAGGVLSLIFLPRLGSTYGTARFRVEMMRAVATVLIPSAILLLIIFLCQRTILAALYDPRFIISDETAGMFIIGCWIRIASWLFLFGLFSAHRTAFIVAGEFLSLPLYAFLLWVFSDGINLERAAQLYLISYLVYFGFNAICLVYSLGPSGLDEDASK